jgi:hypothetical protein
LEREDGGSFRPVEELHLSPEQATNLRVRLAVNGPPGESLRSSIAFRTNDPDSPEWRLEVFVPRIIGGLVTVPRTVVLGTVLTGRTARQVLEVRDPNPEPQEIERVSTTHPDGLAARWLPAEGDERASASPVAGAFLGRVEVSLLCSDPGTIDEGVDIYQAGRRPVRVSVVGRVAPLVELSPVELLLPRSSATGDIWFGTCMCPSNEHLPLQVSPGASDDGLAIRISAADGSPHMQIIRVEWDRSDKVRSADVHRRLARLLARVGDSQVPLELPVQCGSKEER